MNQDTSVSIKERKTIPPLIESIIQDCWKFGSKVFSHISGTKQFQLRLQIKIVRETIRRVRFLKNITLPVATQNQSVLTRLRRLEKQLVLIDIQSDTTEYYITFFVVSIFFYWGL